MPHPSVGAIIGKRDAGKSALGIRLAELSRDRAAPYVVGMPSQAHMLLLEWFGVADSLEDVPPGAVVVIDEAYLQLHARNSMSDAGRSIGALVSLSRQRRQSLIFVVQEARQLDLNIISQLDWRAVKELTELSREFERKELKPYTDRARAAFSTIKAIKNRWTWVYSEATGESAMLENELPSFWRPALSHAYASAVGTQQAGWQNTRHRKGTKTPRAELEARAKAMRRAGHSYGQIAKALGVSKSTAYELVNGRR